MKKCILKLHDIFVKRHEIFLMYVKLEKKQENCKLFWSG